MPDSPFTRRVLSVVRRIPPGRVATYGDIAAAAGKPRAARAVGNIMRECKGNDVPAHRVIAAAGQIGGYGGNIELKKALLRAEGVTVTGRKVKQFSRIRVQGGQGVTGSRVPRGRSAKGRKGPKGPG